MKSNSKKGSKYPRLRAFCSAAALTSCLLLLGTGFLVADYNTRRIGTGDSCLRIDGTIQDGMITVNILGHMLKIELSEPVQAWAGRAWTLLSPGVRAVVWLYEAECEAVSGLVRWVGS